MNNDIIANQILNEISEKNLDFTIFEEGTNPELHDEFFTFVDSLSDDNLSLKNIDKDIDNLFNKNTSNEQKKILLTKFAFSTEVETYRAIEKFIKDTDNKLNEWAILCKQQSRSILETTLSEKSQIYVSSGMGGVGNKLRFMGIFTKNEDIAKFSEFHFDIIKKELNFTLKQNDAIIEEINEFDNFVSFVFLISINISLRDVLDKIVDDCNDLGDFISENIYVTNTKKLDKQEITELVNKN